MAAKPTKEGAKLTRGDQQPRAKVAAEHLPGYLSEKERLKLTLRDQRRPREADDPAESQMRKALGLSPVPSWFYESASPEDETLPPEAAASRQFPMEDTETINAFAARKGLTVAQLEALADRWAAVSSDTTERAGTARTTTETSPQTVPAPTATPHRVTADELFEGIPPERQAKRRQKYDFAPELLSDPVAISKAESIANARTYKRRRGIPLTPAEDARGKMAESLVKKAKSQLAKTSPGGAG